MTWSESPGPGLQQEAGQAARARPPGEAVRLDIPSRLIHVSPSAAL